MMMRMMMILLSSTLRLPQFNLMNVSCQYMKSNIEIKCYWNSDNKKTTQKLHFSFWQILPL